MSDVGYKHSSFHTSLKLGNKNDPKPQCRFNLSLCLMMLCQVWRLYSVDTNYSMIMTNESVRMLEKMVMLLWSTLLLRNWENC